MKSILKIFLFAFIVFNFFSNCFAGSKESVKISVFYSLECEECQDIIKAFLPELERDYLDKIEIRLFEVSDSRNYNILSDIEDRMGISSQGWPIIVVGSSVLIGKKNIINNISNEINSAINRKAFLWPEELTREFPGSKQTADANIEKKITSLTFFAVLGAGLFDGINPCAFITIIFLVFYMNFIGRRKKQILLIGSIYTAAVFITYFMIGFGVLKILRPVLDIHFVGRIIYFITAILALILAFFSLLDYFKARNNEFRSMFLQLTNGLKEKIHKIIREKARTTNIVVFAILTGFFIALFELPCTGQVYLPIIIAISNRILYKKALMLLIIYNLMFIVPLIIVFLISFIGVSSKNISDYFTRNIAKIKIVTAFIFFVLAGILFYAAF